MEICPYKQRMDIVHTNLWCSFNTIIKSIRLHLIAVIFMELCCPVLCPEVSVLLRLRRFFFFTRHQTCQWADMFILGEEQRVRLFRMSHIKRSNIPKYAVHAVFSLWWEMLGTRNVVNIPNLSVSLVMHWPVCYHSSLHERLGSIQCLTKHGWLTQAEQ